MKVQFVSYFRLLLAIATLGAAVRAFLVTSERSTPTFVHPSVVLMLGLLGLSSIAAILSYTFANPVLTSSASRAVCASTVAAFVIVLSMVRIYWCTWHTAVESKADSGSRG